MIENIKTLFIGMRIAVYYWHSVVFNYKVPMGICWLIAILSTPINIILLTIVSIITRRNMFVEIGTEIVQEINEEEA